MLNQTDLNYTITEFQKLVAAAEKAYYPVVYFCGADQETRSQVLEAAAAVMSWPYLAIALPLAERLSAVPANNRTRHLERELDVLLPDSRTLILDRIELLFDRDLQVNPLQLLQSLSRRYHLLVSWPGQLLDMKLVYAQPWHSEYCSYPADNLLIHTMI